MVGLDDTERLSQTEWVGIADWVSVNVRVS